MKVKALEFNGIVFLSEAPTPIDQMWCVAKNYKDGCDMKKVQNLSKIWWTKKHYNCCFDATVMQQVKELEKELSALGVSGRTPEALVNH